MWRRNPCFATLVRIILEQQGSLAAAHAVYLPRPRIEIPGPQGIQATFDWQAAKATSPARMCTAVLVNTVTGY